MNILEKNVNGPKLRKFLTDYFFLLLLLVGIAVNYYFEMKVNRSIKKFTFNQELITQYQLNAGQVYLLNKRLGSLENKVRNYIISGDSNVLRNFQEDSRELMRESVLLSDNLRQIAPPDMLYEHKKSVQQKIAFENRLLTTYREKGNSAAVTLIHSNEAQAIQEKLNLNTSILSAKISGEILP